MKNVSLLIGILFLWACMPKIDSLWYDKDLLKFSQFNSSFLSNYSSRDASLTHFAIVADTHQNYDDLNKVVSSINDRSDLDGVISLGDFTNKGEAIEYRYFLDVFSKIRKPSYSIIGNHDAVGIGPRIFLDVFGPLNQDFETDLVHFIFLNNNVLETGPIDWVWLEQVLNKNTTGLKVVFMHVNYNNEDFFSKETSELFLALMKDKRVGLVINGHRHVHNFEVKDTVPFLQAHRVEGERFNTVAVSRVQPGEYDIFIYRCRKGPCELAQTYRFVE